MPRLKTSEKTKEILKELENRSNLRPNILARIAINLVINAEKIPPEKNYDNNGLELRKETLFGNYEILFKALILQNEKENTNKNNLDKIKDMPFYPDKVKQYLDFGAELLKSEYEFAGNFDQFTLNLIDNKVG
ncbi:MAG: DndE family protein [Candidatus Woesearchaeota archaeon]